MLPSTLAGSQCLAASSNVAGSKRWPPEVAGNQLALAASSWQPVRTLAASRVREVSEGECCNLSRLHC